MKYLIIDTGPIIKGARLERVGAERVVTIPEVLREVRDPNARALLASLPFEIELREPSDEAMRAGAQRPIPPSATGPVGADRPTGWQSAIRRKLMGYPPRTHLRTAGAEPM